MTDSQSTMASALERFLKKRHPDAKSIQVLDVTPLTGGYSCVTTSFTAVIDGARRTLLARADTPSAEAVIQTDRAQEWRLLSTLTAMGDVPIPRALYADEDGSELGARTIVMEFAEGGPFLTKVRNTPEEERGPLADAMCDLATRIHAVDIGPLPLEKPQSWNLYIDALVESWRSVEAELSDSIPMLRYMAAWLDANRPPEAALTLVHGDFQTGNQVLDADGNLLAVDWELAHIGDPRSDIGWCKWVESVQPPSLIGLDDAAFCRRYRERTGLSEEVVNPLTIAYFSILPAMRVFAGVLRSQQAFVEGANTSIRNAYLVGAVVAAYDGWFQATRQIGVATATANAKETA